MESILHTGHAENHPQNLQPAFAAVLAAAFGGIEPHPESLEILGGKIFQLAQKVTVCAGCLFQAHW